MSKTTKNLALIVVGLLIAVSFWVISQTHYIYGKGESQLLLFLIPAYLLLTIASYTFVVILCIRLKDHVAVRTATYYAEGPGIKTKYTFSKMPVGWNYVPELGLTQDSDTAHWLEAWKFKPMFFCVPWRLVNAKEVGMSVVWTNTKTGQSKEYTTDDFNKQTEEYYVMIRKDGKA